MTAIFRYSMIVITPHIGAVLDRLQLTYSAVPEAVHELGNARVWVARAP